MAKKITGFIKLRVPAGSATPAPPVGPALGQRGVNIMEFCKAYNAKTQDKKGQTLPVIITVYSDKSFSFQIKQPSAGDLIKAAINLKKGSSMPNKEKVGKVAVSQLRKLAEQKMPDLNTDNVESAIEMFKGSALSMGLEILNDEN